MDIIVCVKRVPDVAEAEVDIDSSGRGIQLGTLGYVINEWDNFAIEAAVQLKEAHGGRVTAITVGGEDDEEVLRRAMAMGADEALHLMDPAAVGKAPYPFKGEGDGIVGKPELKGGHVWINETQYFVDIPPVSWEFYIGGYQPAQKWLKDRKGRALNFDDVKHYQSILKILSETDRIMQTITMEFET